MFVKILCERYPGTKFVLFAQKGYKLSFKEIGNLKIVAIDSLLSRVINYILRKLGTDQFLFKLLSARCDAIVHIGGSLFIQGDNWLNQIKMTKEITNLKKPYYLLGVNFGPYDNLEYYQYHREIFKTLSDVCFREEYSYNLFKDLENTRLADDIVFQLKVHNNNLLEDDVVISVIKPSYRKHLTQYDDIYYEKMKDIAVSFIKKGLSVTLMSFCENEGDQEAVEEIYKRIPMPQVKSVTKHGYHFNMKETIALIGKCKFVVASRFHAMILGWVLNKPVYPIVYSEKMTNVMKDISFKGVFCDFSSIRLLEADSVTDCFESNLVDVSRQRVNAQKHFKLLDEYLSLG